MVIEIFGQDGLEEVVVKVKGGRLRIPVIPRASLMEPRFEGCRPDWEKNGRGVSDGRRAYIND